MIKNPDAAVSRSWRIGLKAYSNDDADTLFTGKRFKGWAEIENGFDMTTYEQTEGPTGNVQPPIGTGITTHTEMMVPRDLKLSQVWATPKEL